MADAPPHDDPKGSATPANETTPATAAGDKAAGRTPAEPVKGEVSRTDAPGAGVQVSVMDVGVSAVAIRLDGAGSPVGAVPALIAMLNVLAAGDCAPVFRSTATTR